MRNAIKMCINASIKVNYCVEVILPPSRGQNCVNSEDGRY